MEIFKIEHFTRDNPSKEFPRFSSLKSNQAKEIYNRISSNIGENLPPGQLVKKINKIGVFVDNENAENDTFILKKVFDKLGISPDPEVYINWYQFDNIDKIGLQEFSNYFDDIWYPASDDIDIFDSTFSWILSIYHDGSIKIVKLKKA